MIRGPNKNWPREVSQTRALLQRTFHEGIYEALLRAYHTESVAIFSPARPFSILLAFPDSRRTTNYAFCGEKLSSKQAASTPQDQPKRPQSQICSSREQHPSWLIKLLQITNELCNINSNNISKLETLFLLHHPGILRLIQYLRIPMLRSSHLQIQILSFIPVQSIYGTMFPSQLCIRLCTPRRFQPR